MNCPPCRASIPHITEIQKKYDREQLVVVANHCQGGGAANAAKVWLSHSGGDSSVSVVDGGSLPNADVRGIPRVFVFDHTGAVVYDGHPAQSAFDEAIENAVRRAPGFLVAGRDFEVLRSEAARIGAMRGNLSGTIGKLRELASDEEARGHDEAEFLMGRLTEWSTREYEAISEEPAADALRTGETLKRMVALLRGDELGEKFVELDKKLRSDRQFQAEVRAAKVLAALEANANRQMGKVNGGNEERVKASIRRQIAEFKRRYAETVAAERADELARRLGV